MKGRNLTDGSGIDVITKDFNYSKTTSVGSQSGALQRSLVNYVGERIELKTKTKVLRDDEMNVEINYYKNINGEGYMLLPRRFNCEVQVRETHEVDKPFSTPVARGYEIWDEVDTIVTGKCFYPVPVDGICFADYMAIFDRSDTTNYDGITAGYYKLASDGSRFTILARDITVFNNETVDGENWGLIYDSIPKYEHAGKYHIYTDLLELKVDKGFNSPEFIATQLTEQLQEATPPENIAWDDTGSTQHLHIATSETETKTFKTFNCAWNGGNKKTNHIDFHNATPTDAEKKSGIDYISSYEYIGCKRPEVFTSGREVNSWDEVELFIKNTISSAGPTTNTMSPIVTNWRWTNDAMVEPFLQKMAELFKQQRKYPELFKNNNSILNPEVTEDTARFLHINRFNNSDGDIEDMLGFDNHYDRGSNRSSIPIFFKFDNTYKDVMTNGYDIDKLSYGFATKTYVVDDWYITLHPELVGGIKPNIFKEQPATTITADTTLIGWDWNFNAYSTCCCLLYSGVQRYSYDSLTENGLETYTNGSTTTPPGIPSKAVWDLSSHMNKTYVGANNSAVTYNNNHFSFEYLHTTENVGQDFNAGKTGTLEGEKNVDPIIADAGQECYKINKRLQHWTWCPDMRPYLIDTQIFNNVVKPPLVAGKGAEKDGTGIIEYITKDTVPTQTVKTLNPSIRPFSIMDSHCGISMNIGKSFNESDWKDGLLGILGFTYEQFNPTTVDNTNNRIARVEYSNINSLEYLTTNSQIVSTDAKNYVMNRYGGIMYTTQLPIPQVIPSWGPRRALNLVGHIEYDHYASGLYPAIVEQTTSINVPSLGLPITMLRPYYSIRSDLILQENNKYIGSGDSGIRLPVIAVINKENGDGDFYFEVESPLQFTITQDINLSSITTSIHDPDGRLATLNNGSGIVYKVSRTQTLDDNIINEIMGKK